MSSREVDRRYGYELVEGEYVPVPDEQKVIEDLAAARDEGSTWQAIADKLNERGVEPPNGATWYPMTCRRIAQREEGS